MIKILEGKDVKEKGYTHEVVCDSEDEANAFYRGITFVNDSYLDAYEPVRVKSKYVVRLYDADHRVC